MRILATLEPSDERDDGTLTSLNQIVMCSKLLLAALCLGVSCLCPAADLKIRAETAFVGYGRATGVYPLAVTMRNSGPDARGSLHVSTGDFEMDYPVELPRGAVKRLIAYPQVNYAQQITLDLATNQGDVHGTYQQTFTDDPSSQSVLLIGDGEGDLAFLKPKNGQQVLRMADSYVKPEFAPDRAIAYSELAAIVLGIGAERLGDGSVRALHTYVASGGTLAFLGGASSPVLSDPRWADLLPVRPGPPKTIQNSALLSALSDTPVSAPFTIVTSEPKGEASTRVENGQVILARLDHGLGKTIFFALNPIEPPFSRWPGRRSLFEKVLRPSESERAIGYLQDFSAATNRYSDSPYYSTSSYSPMAGGTTGGYATEDDQAPSDPFNTRLPSAKKVFLILASYFIVIIPINFLLLKKLKRGELAWFTAPVISIAFAGAFFAAAKDLYSAKLSTATQGLIVATNSGNAMFVGRSQLFFPRGGEYDLKMEGLDSVGSPQREDYYYRYSGRSTSGLSDVNPIDVGQVQVPRMDVSNLAFRELGFRQMLPDTKWLEVSLTGRKITVRNVGHFQLDDVSVVVAGQGIALDKDLQPGESQSLTLSENIVADPVVEPAPSGYATGPEYGRPLKYSGLAELTSTTKGIVVRATAKSVPVGPQIGNVVQARQNVVLAYFTGLHYGKRSL